MGYWGSLQAFLWTGWPLWMRKRPWRPALFHPAPPALSRTLKARPRRFPRKYPRLRGVHRHHSGASCRAAAFSLDRYAPLGPMVTMESFTPNSFWSFSAAFSSSVIPQRNSASSSLIFTTSAWESPQRICSLASSGVFHRGSRRFGSKVIHPPFFRAYSTARFVAARTGSSVRLKVPK